jgi:large repetitive protein
VIYPEYHTISLPDALPILNAVSCASSSSCTAVGYQYDPTEQNLAESWNGTSWTTQPSSNPEGATSSTLSGVSCTSSSSCTAVGSSGEQNLAESWNGTSWTTQPSSNPAGATGSTLYGVSCTSSSSCTAVGYQYDPTEQNLAEATNPANLAPPSVTNVSPSSGPAAGGTVVTITGTGFTDATAVDFGTATATSITLESATQVTATSPAGTTGTTVDITVTGPGGTSATSSADEYSYTGPPPQETLTITTGGTGGGTVTGSGISCPGTCTATYSQGTSVTLTAAAGSGSTFGGWSGACTGTGACTITMTAAESVAASFTKTPTGPLTASFTASAVVIHNRCGFIGTFNASASIAPAGAPITQYAWKFGNGTSVVTTGPETGESYNAGSYIVVLTVTDADGATASTSRAISGGSGSPKCS